MYRCDKCGRDNAIVNQCGCDPNNLPTRPTDDLDLIETLEAIGFEEATPDGLPEGVTMFVARPPARS